MILCQISDLHVRSGGLKSFRVVDAAQSLRRCVTAILNLNPLPDVVIVTGDLVDFGRVEEYLFLRRLLDLLTMPYYLIPGNHDQRNALRESFPDHTYLRQSNDRIEYVLDKYPLRLIALDTIIPNQDGGMLFAASVAWLDDTLAQAPDVPTVILMHHPPFRSCIEYMDKVGLANPEILEPVIRRHPQVERILCGHFHRPISARFGGTIASTCPSPAYQLELDLAPLAEPQFTMEPPTFQLHVWSPETGLVTHTAHVNQFAGHFTFS